MGTLVCSYTFQDEEHFEFSNVNEDKLIGTKGVEATVSHFYPFEFYAVYVCTYFSSNDSMSCLTILSRFITSKEARK